MYCYHCGYHIDENKFEEKSSTHQKYAENINNDTEIKYVCPRCGHLIYSGHTEDDAKSLSRACHAELQRGRNDFARGMCAISLGVISLITSLVFFLLSNKLSDSGGRAISFTSPEFWVSVILGLLSVILLVYGCIKTVKGLTTKKTYTNLLKDINNRTFVQ